MGLGAVGEAEQLVMRRKLRSLGVAFGFDAPKRAADLEQTIIDSLAYYWTYNSFFFFCLSLLKHRLKSLVNVERLIALAGDLPDDELVLLLALSRRMIELGETRFKTVLDEYETRGLSMENPPEDEQSEFLISEWGVEKTLEPYGVRARAFYEELPKKFYVLKRVLDENEWLWVRSKLGPTYKADAAYMKIAGLVKSAKDVSERVGCSEAQAKRLWKELADIKSHDDVA